MRTPYQEQKLPALVHGVEDSAPPCDNGRVTR